MDVPEVGEFVFAAAYLVGSVVWPRLFYRVIDPWLRTRIGARFGRRIVWAWESGRSASPLFVDYDDRPIWSQWGWRLEGVDRSTLGGEIKSATVGAMGAAVTAVASLVPLALLGVSYFSFEFPSEWVAYGVFMLSVPIWLYFWAGKRAVHRQEARPEHS